MIGAPRAFSMYRFLIAAAALFAAGWFAAPPFPALARADEDWNRGEYVAALTTYQQLLNGPIA